MCFCERPRSGNSRLRVLQFNHLQRPPQQIDAHVQVLRRHAAVPQHLRLDDEIAVLVDPGLQAAPAPVDLVRMFDRLVRTRPHRAAQQPLEIPFTFTSGPLEDDPDASTVAAALENGVAIGRTPALRRTAQVHMSRSSCGSMAPSGRCMTTTVPRRRRDRSGHVARAGAGATRSISLRGRRGAAPSRASDLLPHHEPSAAPSLPPRSAPALPPASRARPSRRPH